MGPARRDDWPCSRDLDSTRELCQNTSDNKCNKQFRLSLAEMPITRISFLQHKEKQNQKSVPTSKLMCLKSSITKISRRFRLRLSLERSFQHFRCFPRSMEDAFLTTGGLD